MELEYIILDLQGAAALTTALGLEQGWSENNYAAHNIIAKTLDKVIEQLTEIMEKELKTDKAK